MRQCRICKIKYSEKKVSLKNLCRQCYIREWKIKNPENQEIIRERARKWYQDNLEKARINRRNWIKNNLGKIKEHNLKNRERLAGRKKSNCCEICKERNKIVFDHDHKTGNFRGWICNRCNLILGLANDNHKLLNKISQYVYKRNRQPVGE